ncbi:MAG: hypothetical protein UX76_C0019G0032 [Candidatus Wolfebacteria bacterium GW2011_GWC1_47_103]|nr:MAG: hypothetical protein UX76_C0019G0032 [Candidatus Wolfebacteria bacterium GW2011_GWC1_47_103]
MGVKIGVQIDALIMQKQIFLRMILMRKRIGNQLVWFAVKMRMDIMAEATCRGHLLIGVIGEMMNIGILRLEIRPNSRL